MKWKCVNSTTGQNFVSISKLFYGFVSVKLTRRIYVDYIFRLFFCSLLIRAKKGIIFLGRWFELSCIFIQFFFLG